MQRGRHTEATEKTRAEQRQTSKQRKTNNGDTHKRTQAKSRTRNYPEGEESTATKGCQTGGGSEKGHAIGSHKATRPVRAEHQSVPRGK